MHYTTATLLLAASAAFVAHAQDDVGSDPSLGQDPTAEYLMGVCQPTNSSGYPDMSAPCNEVQAIQAQCIWGPSEGLSIFYSYSGANSSDSSSASLRRRQSDGNSDDDGPPEQSNSTQRVCVCQSQFFDLLNGCLACEKAHGAPYDETGYSTDFISSLSSAYCAASSTPTVDLANFLNDFVMSAASSETATATSTSSFSDPIGNKTDVSLYYTQAVTGSSAWVIAQTTGTASATGSTGSAAGNSAPTTGQITPTISGTSTSGSPSGSAASGSASGSSTSTGGAMRTEAAAVAGVLGFAGLVALL